jgi:glycine/D-amino acid oxidase-like deaminating enzyme
MKQVSYWVDSAPSLPDRSGSPLPDKVDIAIVGGGLQGISAAYHAAAKGATVALFEKEHLGYGAATRNGGICMTGTGPGAAECLKKYGLDRARRYHGAYVDAVAMVEKLVADENIDCDFGRVGKAAACVKPAHLKHWEDETKALHDHFDHETWVLGREEGRSELNSDQYYGVWIDPKGAQYHVGKFVVGLADRAEKKGAGLYEKTRVDALKRANGDGFIVRTQRGDVAAKQVLLSTDAYTDNAFRHFQRQFTVVGSFIVATEPLSEALANDIIPKGRTCSDTYNLGHYYRLSPDRRLIWGGRARFAMSNAGSDRKSGAILQRDLLAVFPQLKDTRLDYVWGGLVGFAFDRMPHAGEYKGLYYYLPSNGKGIQMSPYMGKAMIDVMDGHPEANPWHDLHTHGFPTWGSTGWFLPFTGLYYKFKDQVR